MIEQFYRKLLWAGAYPLLLAMMAGATWVDRIYAHALRPVTVEGALAVAMSRVSDRLLLLSLLVIAAGVLCATLLHGVARMLAVASLAVFCLELVVPVAAAMLPGSTIYLGILGPALRVGITLVALALALSATWRALA